MIIYKNSQYSAFFYPFFTYSTHIFLLQSYYAVIALTISARRLYQHWTNLVILAKHWLWLPEDGFFVNRNMLEQPPQF